jgi:hypothetical protein
MDYVDAKVAGVVFLIAISERDRSRFPASAVVTATQRSDRVDELMMRISFLMGVSCVLASNPFVVCFTT